MYHNYFYQRPGPEYQSDLLVPMTALHLLQESDPAPRAKAMKWLAAMGVVALMIALVFMAGCTPRDTGDYAAQSPGGGPRISPAPTPSTLMWRVQSWIPVTHTAAILQDANTAGSVKQASQPYTHLEHGQLSPEPPIRCSCVISRWIKL